MIPNLHTLLRRNIHRLRSPVLRMNAVAGCYQPIIWVIGDGRSGTTWVSGLINANRQAREMFEPFHPLEVKRFRHYSLHEYRVPGDLDPTLRSDLANIFKGQFTHPRVDRGSSAIRYRGLIVKDIFSMLYARWAVGEFPEVRPVILIRNPFSVAKSKRERLHWKWIHRPTTFLSDRRLVSDHLSGLEDTLVDVEERGESLLTYLVIWAVLHRVAFRQFEEKEAYVLFYENAVQDAVSEMEALSRFLGCEAAGLEAIKTASTARSSVSLDNSVQRSRRDPYGSWREKLTDDEIREGYAILDRFGLAGLYDLEGQPDHAALSSFPIGGVRSERKLPIRGEGE